MFQGAVCLEGSCHPFVVSFHCYHKLTRCYSVARVSFQGLCKETLLPFLSKYNAQKAFAPILTAVLFIYFIYIFKNKKKRNLAFLSCLRSFYFMNTETIKSLLI